MPAKPFTETEVKSVVSAYRSNALNLSATVRETGMTRQSVRRRLERAVEKGWLTDIELSSENVPTNDAVISARTRKQAAYQKKQKHGSWDKPVAVRVPHSAFRIKLFGDPHMDSNAFDIDLFEKHWFEMDAASGVYGMMIGDMFNNWLRVLGHLWKHEGDPDDAWTLFEHYMAERGGALIACCSGNHDDWSHGPADPIDMMMKRYGVVYRTGAVRVIIGNDSGSVSTALRHKWRGNSMYSPAHALRRAAEKGWHDNIMVGGHTHQDEDRHYVIPRTGFFCNLFQLSAFKKFDDYADVHGFMPHSIQPVRDLVVDLTRADDDPEKVKCFFDSDAAAAHLAWIRSRDPATK